MTETTSSNGKQSTTEGNGSPLEAVAALIGKYGINTILLVLLGYWFIVPVVESHKAFLVNTVEIQRKTQTEVQDLRLEVQKLSEQFNNTRAPLARGGKK